MKKEAGNELRDITRKLSDLNKKLENDPSEATRREVIEAIQHQIYYILQCSNSLIWRSQQNGFLIL